MRILQLAISEITGKLKDGNLYFWGAGKAFDGFISKLPDMLICRIKGIVDLKQNGFKTVAGKSIPVISQDYFLQKTNKKDILIITTSYYEEVVNLLLKLDVENKIRAAVYYLMVGKELEKERDSIEIPSSLRTTEKQLIPKKIHYCWFGKNPIPARFQTWMKSWKKYCPDYEIIEWNETNYDIHKIKYMEQAYEAKKWGFVSDYARLDIIYQHGGVYLDTDVELIRNIDDLLYNEAFCGFEDKDFVAFGLGFGAVPHNNIIKQIMKDYENKTFMYEDGRIDLTACPKIQTESLEKLGLKRNGEYQIINGLAVFPELVLSPFSTRLQTLAKDLTKSYMIHHYAASWAPDYAKKLEERMRFLEHFQDFFVYD